MSTTAGSAARWWADRVRRLGPADLPTALHVAALLAVVEVLVRAVPLPRASRLLGVVVDPAAPSELRAPLDTTALTAGEQRRLAWTRRLADRWPFSRGPCLRRALVGARLLRSRRPVVRLGLHGEGASLVGHAWLEVDGHPLELLDGVTPFRPEAAR